MSASSRRRRSMPSTMAPTWRSLDAVQTRNTSVIARWSETSKATMFWASFSSAASAAAMVSSTARSDAVTGRGFLRGEDALVEPPSHGWAPSSPAEVLAQDHEDVGGGLALLGALDRAVGEPERFGGLTG